MLARLFEFAGHTTIKGGVVHVRVGIRVRVVLRDKKNNSSSSGEERCVTSLKTEDESIHFFLFLNSCLLVISWELTRVLEN